MVLQLLRLLFSSTFQRMVDVPLVQGIRALQKHSPGSLPCCFSEQAPQELLAQGEVALGAAPRGAS